MKYVELTATIKIPVDAELEVLIEHSDESTRDFAFSRLETLLYQVIQAESDDDADISIRSEIKEGE